MAKAPTHYQVTIKRPLMFANARFKPGARYTLKAATFDALKAEHPDAIGESVPMKVG